MVRIGDVWDATTDVLATRGRQLAAVALLAFFLPFAVQGAINAYGGASPGAAALAGTVALLTVPLLVWGVLTVIALAGDAAATREGAGRRALGRLPAALLVALVLVAGALLATLPIFAVLAASGFDFRAAAAASGGAGAPPVQPGAAIFSVLYALLLAGVALWLAARLFLLDAVVLLEGRGIGAFGRSFALTKGLAARLIGVNLLFALVWAVAAFAARSVVFVVFRLLLGGDRIATATWFGGIADALVTTAFMVVSAVFAGRLYVALTAPSKASSQPWG